MLKVLRDVVRNFFRKKSSRRSLPNGSGSSSGSADRPNWAAQCSLVSRRVKRYRDELLRYELGLERHRRNAPRDVLLKLLDGHEQVMSRPVLYLNSDEWKWDQQQLQDVVTRALRELDLQAPTGVREPTSRVERACYDWAVAKAKQVFDQHM